MGGELKKTVPKSPYQFCECSNHYLQYGNVIEEFLESLRKAIETAENGMAGRVEYYERKKWGGREKDKTYIAYQDMINKYTILKQKFNLLVESGCKKGYHDDLLLLAAVAYNEAGTHCELSQKAICYAFLNHTENVVSYPPNNVISHFSKRNFVDGIIRDNRTMDNISTWSGQIVSCLEAAMYRLDKSDKKSNNSYPLSSQEEDIVDEATHWVSPIGLKAEGYTKNNKGICNKGVSRDGYSNCFPNWTQRPDEPNVEEVDVPGIEKNNFMFFKGVRYTRFTQNP